MENSKNESKGGKDPRHQPVIVGSPTPIGDDKVVLRPFDKLRDRSEPVAEPAEMPGATSVIGSEAKNPYNEDGPTPVKARNRGRTGFKDMILFEDDDYILVNKPPFLSTLQDRHGRPDLLALARAYLPEAQVCHRLDKDTSGVLAIAKNPDAYRHLNMQFENRDVGKVYHAVVDGIHNFQDELVDAPILKLDDGVVKISRSEGKAAQTWFTAIKSFRYHSLIECRPITGRMHQIRIHLATQRASITGDATYGGKPFLLSQVKRGYKLKKGTEEEPFMKRMALHAFSLQFNDLGGSRHIVEAPYPKDFQALIRQLELNS